MKISELIEKLEELKEEHGDLDVEFQHCDGGGIYYGSEEITDVEIVENSIDYYRDDKFVLIC